MTRNGRKILLFFLITVVLSAVVNLLIISSGQRAALVFLVMWVPGVAALTSKLVFDKSLRNMGWGWRSTSSHLLAYAIPALLCCVAYGAVWAMGVGGVSVEKFSTAVSREFSLDAQTHPAVLFLLVATLGFAANTLAALGEEIGWTGFLTPELARRYGPATTSITVGLVWAVWHYPGILFGGYNAATSPLVAIPMFTIMLLGFSFIRTWLRHRSKSLWCGVFLHASHNLFVQAVFDQLTVDTGSTKYFTTEFGVALAVVYALGGLAALRRMRWDGVTATGFHEMPNSHEASPHQ